MNVVQKLKTARSVTLEIQDGGIYETIQSYTIYLNGEKFTTTDKVITSLFGLKPETAYECVVEGADGTREVTHFRTNYEFVTLDVRDFGAKGDGVTDDTKFIQAAILACPKESRVLIPRGTYKITSLFLKSDLKLEIAKGAVLLADTVREHFPILPGLVESYNEREEYNLGSWEGNPLKMFAAIITGINVENVVIYGEGLVDGAATHDNWWKNDKAMIGAFRPRMFFINNCNQVVVQGLTFKNSPSWTFHPYFSKNLKFYGLTINNPAQSPNTDGMDPESCENVEIAGVHFSLGDDCIALKSGKIYMGRKYKKPSKNVHIYQCFMENGHGAVTMGSEMAGGLQDILVEKCRFSHTDRGLRIKTRRGRGKDAVLDKIVFRDIEMEHVLSPFTVNAFYFCDPDGRTEFVQSREPYPVDEGTPEIKKLVFENVTAKNSAVCAAYFEGLPEKKIGEIVMKNVHISFGEEDICDVPIMSNGVEKCSKRGIYAKNIEKLTLEDVIVEGQVTEAIEVHEVDKVTGNSYSEE